jgi:arsenate reductase (thioredoxin)
MKGILFLCQHGGAKSVIAAAQFNQLATERGLPCVAAAAASEDPYDAVPSPVVERLQREGLDVREFKPHQAVPEEISAAARVVTIGCDLLDRAAITDRWDDVPAASEDLEGSVAAIRRHVEALARELDDER